MNSQTIRRSPIVRACCWWLLAGAPLVLAVGVAASIDTAAAQPFQDQSDASSNDPAKVRPGMVVGVEPEIITILLRQPKPPNAQGVINGVELQGEVTDERTASDYGWRSMQMKLDISCKERSGHVLSMSVFDQHGASGTARAITAPQGWVALSHHTDESGAIDALCDRWAKGEQKRTRGGASETAQAQARIEHGSDKSRVSGALPHPSASQSAPRNPQTAQIASTTSQALADDLLTKVKTRFPQSFQGLQTRIETATVSGSARYRLIVSGFPNLASAKDFCSTVRLGAGCLIRSGQ